MVINTPFSAFDPVTVGELQLPRNTLSSAASLFKAKFNNLCNVTLA